MVEPAVLWTPKSNQTNLHQFQKFVESRTNLNFSSYLQFHSFSTREFESFWKLWAEYSQFRFIQAPNQVFLAGKEFQNSKWFPDASYNFSENLLEVGDSDSLALVFLSEGGQKVQLTYRELKREVLRLQKHLVSLGVGRGDRVCGLVPNAPISTIGMLATTSLGAIWSSASPDFGVRGILDRFEQINPKILLTVDGYTFKGKEISILKTVEEVSNRLRNQTQSVFQQTIVFGFLNENPTLGSISYPMAFEQIPIPPITESLTYTSIGFSDPVYIMFSSGTTGLPKCIVQGGGVLLNHTKELFLHCNLSKGQKLFYYTTCGWMMWNWSQSVLALGATLYQFDGNPFYPSWEVLWKYAEEESIDVFGTSAKYLSVLSDENRNIKSKYSLPSLNVILSTGSPLSTEGFRYIYDHVKTEVQLSSISGGTDLNGCFALGNPNLPVIEGEIQCLGLGMDVQVYNEEGKPVLEEKGELVCPTPFPSMPLYFWNDPSGEKYKSAYFSTYPNVWCHGDFVMVTKHSGLIVYGRSDATLNPGGVRIGTADIYSVLQNLPEVSDSVIIGQEYKNDVRVILFCVLRAGEILTEDLIEKIKSKIKNETSPRHVPSLIFEVPEIPYTVNGKKVEIAVKQTIAGETVKNKNALANPNSLDYFLKFKNLE
ncbi:MAG: acetoacetate--CoA ligase [Leptospira sp.]|nr:acetoacetate--CoA ligase [Leptospira sp.]